ncbi:MAG: DNA alkylation repair protein, partial [Chlorobiaceae bacterium]|nr:DNA alkylation repair protein [Chlorobiaceae bacterium]
MIYTILARLEALADLPTAEILRRFFKTGPGEYGEGDRFRGIRVPVLRKLCREFRHIGLETIYRLLGSSWHEDRLLALLLLIDRYRTSDEAARQSFYDFYCGHTARINNWDLVDLSAPYIVGRHLESRDRS